MQLLQGPLDPLLSLTTITARLQTTPNVQACFQGGCRAAGTCGGLQGLWMSWYHLPPPPSAGTKTVQIEGMGGFLGSITNYLATIIQCHATVAIFSLSSALVMIGKVLVIHQDHSDEYFWGRRRCGKELGCRGLTGLGSL